MFSGITETSLIVQQIKKNPDSISIVFKRPHHRCLLGGSILLNGICSTITAVTKATVTVQYMPETVRLTTVSRWRSRQQVNAEWPLTLQTELSGSIVSGHVDAVGTVQRFTHDRHGYSLTIACPKSANPYLIHKGGITINGVNLTITAVKKNQVTVHLIPYTLEHTTLNSLVLHDKVNLEYDYIAKIVVQYLKKRS